MRNQSEENLTKRQIEVAALVLKGLSNKEIAYTLFISLTCVKWHLNNIYRYFEVHSRYELISKINKLT